MVHVNVNVQHSLVHPQQLQNGYHDVIHVAEPAGFTLFCVMQPSRPVYGHLGLVRHQYVSGVDGPPSGELAEVEQPRKVRVVRGVPHSISIGLRICVVGLYRGRQPLIVVQQIELRTDVGAEGGDLIRRQPCVVLKVLHHLMRHADVLTEVLDVLWFMELLHLLDCGCPVDVYI